MPVEFAYITPAQVWDALKLGTPQTPGVPAYGPQAPDAVQAALLRKIHAACARINSETHRVFTPTTFTRLYDAPRTGMLAGPTFAFSGDAWFAGSNPFLVDVIRQTPAALLEVPDLQSITTISAFGVALAPSDYQIIRYATDEGHPESTVLLRVANGIPVSWYYGAPTPWQPLGAISITGVYCYDPAGVPDAVIDVAEGMVVRSWTRRGRLYASEQGQGMQGYSKEPNLTMDADLKEALTPYTADISTEIPL